MPSDEQQPATRSDIQRIDQKTDRIAAELVKTQGRMDQLINRLEAKMDAGFSRVLSAIDAFAGKAEIYDRKPQRFLDESNRGPRRSGNLI